MKTLGDRFKHARQTAGFTQQALGTLIGISKAAISQIETGATQTLASSTMLGVERYTGFSGRWIATGKGEAVVGPPIKVEDPDQIARICAELIKLPAEYREKIEKEIEFFASLSLPRQ